MRQKVEVSLSLNDAFFLVVIVLCTLIVLLTIQSSLSRIADALEAQTTITIADPTKSKD